MTSAELSVDVAETWLSDPAAARVLARRAERQMVKAMDTLGWLVYRINTPVLRAMFMSPSNKLRMRDGLIAMLAGNLRIDRRMRAPVLAFKAVYYLLTALTRFGVRLELPPVPASQVVPAE